ncbi:MAG: aldo/keto reductase [Clostridiales bacterium]|nr:aldo/keto reductase [Clostridiales bacterium]
MEKRRLGKTGMEASVIGLGCEHLDNKPYEIVDETISAAIESGINIFDVFMPGEEVRKNIGRALSGKRDGVLVQGHIGSVDLRRQYDISREPSICKRYFYNLLRDLKTDWIDFGMLFFIDSQKAFDEVINGEILRFAQRLKENGTIRAIGASSHNPLIARQVAETGAIDLLLFSINPAFDMTPLNQSVLDSLDADFKDQKYFGIRPDRLELYRLCESLDIAITVMKTLGGGKLLSAGQTPFVKPMTAAQCIHYALTRPAVASALIGCQSREQVLEAVKYLDASDDERDCTSIVNSFQSFAGNCVYCGHCQPCPSNIDIAAVNKYLDIARLSEAAPPSVISHYKFLDARGGDCLACGSCEERCPFNVSIIKNMGEAVKVFGE